MRATWARRRQAQPSVPLSINISINHDMTASGPSMPVILRPVEPCPFVLYCTNVARYLNWHDVGRRPSRSSLQSRRTWSVKPEPAHDGPRSHGHGRGRQRSTCLLSMASVPLTGHEEYEYERRLSCRLYTLLHTYGPLSTHFYSQYSSHRSRTSFFAGHRHGDLVLCSLCSLFIVFLVLLSFRD